MEVWGWTYRKLCFGRAEDSLLMILRLMLVSSQWCASYVSFRCSSSNLLHQIMLRHLATIELRCWSCDRNRHMAHGLRTIAGHC
ncbi:hypothetical protein BDV39DRAFT_165039 [Aspergillus sergii]|uniref:Uncharacterized protein n=1 Tax=Aspergillus sergii TaxID=1034303 RepID=A0A5N6XK82_9EURO|nr:hypothetical protein BDV39DRAFT_165039 [Aspergillus sergii]